MKPLLSVDDIVIVYAFRYALGKPYSMAKPIYQWVKSLWASLPPHARDQMMREARVMIERGEAGDSNALLMWDSLVEYGEKYKKDFPNQ